VLVDGWADGFHQVECEGVARAVVGVDDPDGWVESDGEARESCFGFEQCVQVVEERIGGGDRET